MLDERMFDTTPDPKKAEILKSVRKAAAENAKTYQALAGNPKAMEEMEEFAKTVKQ